MVWEFMTDEEKLTFCMAFTHAERADMKRRSISFNVARKERPRPHLFMRHVSPDADGTFFRCMRCERCGLLRQETEEETQQRNDTTCAHPKNAIPHSFMETIFDNPPSGIDPAKLRCEHCSNLPHEIEEKIAAP